ncbi:DNA-binding transcriptional regulator, LysR family [Noviherbaspirillum humi]|uniref:DNA-binding transcriptional regulator, LysR family n=1 Tax=Noviherbaspirillum humi TaxID=1688639 RepID=A0A239JSZ6_9BURK|nr:LysR family transcriptional regulator [Noviherbaspirillum humi]SNT08513.1 DNA-binding transcriptional regulator, LysR family [Noviherbaspirillum humi]
MKNSDFDWNDLKYFLAVARHGGLTGAAASLDTSPSTVSRHIASLEKKLGNTLFVRHQTGYAMTDDGSALFSRTEQVEQAVMATERSAAQAAQRQMSGQVRLATTEMLALHLVVPNLPQFHSAYPRLQVEIVVALVRANLTRREADLALRVVPPSEDDDAGDYVANRIGDLRFAMYGERRAVESVSAKAAAWQEMDYVSWDEAAANLPVARWIASAFGGKRPLFACNSMQAQYTAIRAGLGIGLLPCFVADRDPALARIPVPIALPSNGLWLVYHRDLKGSQRVLALRNFIAELAVTHLEESDAPGGGADGWVRR